MNQLINRLEAHGIEIPEKQASFPAPGPASPVPPKFLTDTNLKLEETVKSIDAVDVKMAPESNDTTTLATTSEITPRSS